MAGWEIAEVGLVEGLMITEGNEGNGEAAAKRRRIREGLLRGAVGEEVGGEAPHGVRRVIARLIITRANSGGLTVDRDGLLRVKWVLDGIYQFGNGVGRADGLKRAYGSACGCRSVRVANHLAKGNGCAVGLIVEQGEPVDGAFCERFAVVIPDPSRY